jgi:L-histidine N-alpha-methyltransferase
MQTTFLKVLAQPNQHLRRDGEDVIQGLNKYQKTLPSQYFYDDRGSELFEQICELPEYYPTGTEAWILQQYYADEIAQITGACELVELGSGSSTKIRLSKIRRTKTQFTNYNGEYSVLVNN